MLLGGFANLDGVSPFGDWWKPLVLGTFGAIIGTAAALGDKL